MLISFKNGRNSRVKLMLSIGIKQVTNLFMIQILGPHLLALLVPSCVHVTSPAICYAINNLHKWPLELFTILESYNT